MLLLLIFCLTLRVFASSQITFEENSGAQYKVYRSPTNDHVVRIKPQNDTICDARTRQWTGWLSTGSKHLFFWYFDKSPDSSNEDSLTLWLTGGPGTSSMAALFGENGPCSIAEKGNSTKHNPYGWTQASSMLFVDQPAGVGFSYVDKGTPYPDNSFTGAEDMTAFMQIFLGQVFPGKSQQPFHIAGESYGGHYVPTLAAEITRQNIANPGRTHIPLRSILIGNGWISPGDTMFGHWDTLCTTKPGVKEPIFNSTRCDIIAEIMPRCTQLYNVCYNTPDPAICNAAAEVCFGVNGLFYSEIEAGGRNPFDISRKCDFFPYCYKRMDYIETYLNQSHIWKALDVPSTVKNWALTSLKVNQGFVTAGDLYISTQPQIQFVLAQGIDVLIYQGNLDLACNTAGNLHWANSMPWKGQMEFSSKSLVPWIAEVDGKEKPAGTFKEVSIDMKNGGRKVRFAFVTVDGSGHLLPQDQPEIALEMVNRWLAERPFGDDAMERRHDDL